MFTPLANRDMTFLFRRNRRIVRSAPIPDGLCGSISPIHTSPIRIPPSGNTANLHWPRNVLDARLNARRYSRYSGRTGRCVGRPKLVLNDIRTLALEDKT
jgi:hypothetical protein